MGAVSFAQPFNQIAHLCAAERGAAIGQPSLNDIGLQAPKPNLKVEHSRINHSTIARQSHSQREVSGIKEKLTMRMPKRGRKRNIISRRRRLFAETLEDRRLLAVTASILQPDNQVLFEGDGSNDLVQFSVVDGYLQHNLGSLPGFASARDLDSVTPGEQALLLSEIGSFRYEDAGENDRFFFTGIEPIAFGEADVAVSAGEVTVNAGTAVSSVGGQIVLTAATEFLLSAGSSLTTVDGGISLTANPDGASAGEFIGLEIQGATIAASGTGNIELVGFGGNDTGEPGLHGIVIGAGTTIESTGQFAGAGTVSIHGTAGDGSSSSNGVRVDGTDIIISSGYGNIDIVGRSLPRISNGSTLVGVLINSADKIESTGTGPDAATITIDGTGGAGSRFNYGVWLRGATTDITSVDGDINIVGQGGGKGFLGPNQGVFVDGIGSIASTGDTGDAATITIIGDGGNGNSNDLGVSISANTRVSSGYGDIQITGRGGISDKPSNHGLSLGGIIESTGSDQFDVDGNLVFAAATISIDGTGGLNSSSIGAIVWGTIDTIDGDVTIIGRGINNNDGARVSAAITATGTAALTIEGTSENRTGTVLHSDAYLASHDGPILVKGQGSAVGVSIDGMRGIQSTGVSNGATPSLATITIKAFKIETSAEGVPVEVVGGSVIGSGIAEGISSVDGAILITGQAIGSRGVSLSNFGAIESTGTGPLAATITIEGTSGAGGSDTYGVHLAGSTSSVKSTDGDINISGAAGDASLSIITSRSNGVLIESVEVVSEGDAMIHLNGTAGAARSSRAGVQLTGATIRSTTADVLVEGEQVSPSAFLWGVAVSGGQIVSEGTANFTFQSNTRSLFSANASLADGDLLINALSGSEARTTGTIISQGDGTISVIGGIATVGIIESAFGDITIEGQSITVSGDLTSTGTGPNAAKIQIGGEMARTIQVSGNLASVDGDISIANQIDDPTVGTGYIRISGNIESAGTDKDTAATITINGSAADREIGVRFMGADQTISSVAGDIHITGRGGQTTFTSGELYGVELERITNIRSTGTGDDAAKITIDGTGGIGGSANTGVLIDGDNASQITSVNGAILITGTGGSKGVGVNLREVSIEQRVIGPDDPEFDPDDNGLQAAGITISATGGTVQLDIDTTIHTVDGDVRIEGNGGTGEYDGVQIIRSQIVSTGVGGEAGTLTIDGTAGQGEFGEGVYVLNSAFESQDGAISVIGRGGGIRTTGLDWVGSTVSSNGTGEHAATIDLVGIGADGTRNNHGIEIEGTATEITSVDGDITIDGRGGDTGDFSFGLIVTSLAQIASTGDSPDAAKISINGTGGSQSGSGGILFAFTSQSLPRQITSGYGDITITGEATSNSAVNFQSHPWRITSTGQGDHAANISVAGTGAVNLLGPNGEMTSIDGDITLNAIDGSLSVSVPVKSLGTSAGAGDITISGIGGGGVGVGGLVETRSGDVTISGAAISSSGTRHGVAISGTVSSIGTVASLEPGVDPGLITITGSTTDADASGVYIDSGNVTSEEGDIKITGTGGGGRGAGVYLRQQVSSNGTDKATAATITIDGSAGTGSRDSAGVLIIAGGDTLPNLTTVAGDVTIKGIGGTGGSGGDSAYFGIHLRNAYVASFGTDPANAGNIRIEGIGGTNGNSNLIGVEIDSSTSQLVSVAGDIEIVATAGIGTGPLNLGLRIDDLSEIGDENTVGNITLRTDSIDLKSGSIQSSGTLTIEPKTNGTSVGLGGGVGELNLDDAELARLVDGFAGITIGSDLAGELQIDTATFTDDVTLVASVIRDGSGNDIDAIGNTVTLRGQVSPGQSPGVLQVTSNLALADDSTLDLEINGLTPGETAGSHDQVDVTGTVTIGENVALQLTTTNGFSPLLGQQFVLLSNDGSDPIVGQFSGLPEGAILSNFLGQPLSGRISYLGLDEATGNDVVITIIEGNQAPTADAGGPYNIEEGDLLILDASGSSDPDEDELIYRWDLNGDGDFSDANGETPTLTYAELEALGLGGVEQFQITLQVDDGLAAPAFDTATVNVVLNEPPVANAGEPVQVVEGISVSVTLDASGTTDDRPVENLIFTWDLDGDGIFGETGADAARGDEIGMRPVFFAAELDGPQVVNVTLRVEDDRGAVDFDTTSISVLNVAPTIELSTSPVTVVRGTPIQIDGSFTDPGPDTWTATVDFADGNGPQQLTLDGKTFQLNHLYQSAGVYSVRVTVQDDDGGSATETLTVVVELPPLPDLTLISSDVLFDPINPGVGEPVNFEIDVRNEGTLAAQNVPVSVQFFDTNTDSFVEIGRTVITSIAAGSEIPISLTWDGTNGQPALPTEDSYLLVRVELDPDALTEETDETNNTAIQVLQIGSPDITSASLAVTVSPFQTTRGNLVAVGGQAIYDFDGIVEFPVQNAIVTTRLIHPDTDEILTTLGTRTSPQGSFTSLIRAPEIDDEYILRFEISDGTFSTVVDTTLTVQGETLNPPPRSRSSTGSNTVFFSSIDFTQPTAPPGNPQIGVPVTIFGNFEYTLNQALTVPVAFNNLFPVAGQLQTFRIGSEIISFPEGAQTEPAQFAVNWVPTAEGFHIIQLTADPEFTNDPNTSLRAQTRTTQLVLVGDLDTSSLNLDYGTSSVPGPTVTFNSLTSSNSRSSSKSRPSSGVTRFDDSGDKSPAPGETILLTITYENTGSSTITGGLLIDNFDELLLGTPTNISHGGVVDGNLVRWELGDLAPGETGVVSYEVTINPAAEFPAGAAFLDNTGILNADQAAAAARNEILISNNSPVITTLTVDPIINEDGSVTLAGTFSDPNTTDTHTIVIDWGDGLSDTLTLTEGERSFLLEHTYALIPLPQVSSFTIGVSITDQSGRNTTDSVETLVPALDDTAPSSTVFSSSFEPGSSVYDIQVDFADPDGANGAAASGVETVDIFYRVNPQLGDAPTQFFGRASLNPAAVGGAQVVSGTLNGLPGDVIQLWSVATDAAGNVEDEVTPRTDYAFVIPDTVGPDTQVDTAVFDGVAFIDLTVSGTDVGGGNVNSIEVYVEINPGAVDSEIALVGTIPGGANSISGSISFAVPPDGIARDYRFFSIGTDQLGNREGGSGTFDGDPGADGDVLLTDIAVDEPDAVEILAFDANNGLENRSSVHSADLVFNDPSFVDDLMESMIDSDPENDRIRLERQDLAGNPIGDGQFLAFDIVRDGLQLRLDFGLNGLQQNGVYAIHVDMDGNNENGFEETRRFHRLLGDTDGNGIVDTNDLAKVRRAYRNPALHPDADVDGDGDVDRNDLRFYSRFFSRPDAEKELGLSRDELDD
jgi:hypothetical protein